MEKLNEAAWKVVNEVSAARREMGVDFPAELVEAYEAVKALEGLLVAQREDDLKYVPKTFPKKSVVPNADEIVSSWQASRRGRIGEVLNYVQQMPDPKWLTEDPGYPALRDGGVKDAQVIAVPDGFDLSTLPEDKMRQFGWVKRESATDPDGWDAETRERVWKWFHEAPARQPWNGGK